MKKYIIKILLLIISIILTINYTYANSNISIKLYEYVKNNKEKLIKKEWYEKILKNIVWEYISEWNIHIFLNKYVNNDQNKPYVEIWNDGYIYINYNKYMGYNEKYNTETYEIIRKEIIRYLFENNIVDIDDDIKQFDIEIFKDWNIVVSKNDYSTNKKDTINEYIASLPLKKEIKNEFKSINKNIYLDILLSGNNLVEMWKFKIDINNIKDSLIIRNVEEFNELFSVSSYRFRSWYKYDDEYRKYNIKAVYDTNNKFVLYPNQKFSFHSLYELWDKKFGYKEGTAIINWKEKKWIYGWWVCGAATWIYQWALFNKNLEFSTRNHSLWYNMYSANINWNKIYTPWLDSTYYDKNIDLSIKNIWRYPVIFVNRIWEGHDIEENFTLSMNYEKNNTISNLDFLWKDWNCYKWNIDWNVRTSCYKNIEK